MFRKGSVRTRKEGPRLALSLNMQVFADHDTHHTTRKLLQGLCNHQIIAMISWACTTCEACESCKIDRSSSINTSPNFEPLSLSQIKSVCDPLMRDNSHMMAYMYIYTYLYVSYICMIYISSHRDLCQYYKREPFGTFKSPWPDEQCTQRSQCRCAQTTRTYLSSKQSGALLDGDTQSTTKLPSEPTIPKMLILNTIDLFETKDLPHRLLSSICQRSNQRRSIDLSKTLSHPPSPKIVVWT